MPIIVKILSDIIRNFMTYVARAMKLIPTPQLRIRISTKDNSLFPKNTFVSMNPGISIKKMNDNTTKGDEINETISNTKKKNIEFGFISIFIRIT